MQCYSRLLAVPEVSNFSVVLYVYCYVSSFLLNLNVVQCLKKKYYQKEASRDRLSFSNKVSFIALDLVMCDVVAQLFMSCRHTTLLLPPGISI